MNEIRQQESMIGRFAFSKAGHDKGQLYVIVSEDQNFYGLCDGRVRTLDKPKRKRRRHVQCTKGTVERSLLEKLAARDKVQDEEIKFQIKNFLKKNSNN